MPATLASTAQQPSAGSHAPGASELLMLNPVDFEQHFAREPFIINHSLCNHPLFQMERILELSKTLPDSCIEYNAGDLPVSIDPRLTPRNGLSPEETIRRIAECQSWMVLKYVERDPAYRELLNSCLKLLAPYTDPIAPGMTQPQAFIFVSSPGSVTPYHIDPEHNFLLQIQGSKQIRMLDGRDPSILSQADLEHFYSDHGRNLKFKSEHLSTGWTFQLQPGQGLHFPVTYPHWVKNGDAVSISLSITFRTPDLDKRRALYQINGFLRQNGFSPWSVGHSVLRDNLYYNSFRLVRRGKSMTQRPTQD